MMKLRLALSFFLLGLSLWCKIVQYQIADGLLFHSSQEQPTPNIEQGRYVCHSKNNLHAYDQNDDTFGQIRLPVSFCFSQNKEGDSFAPDVVWNIAKKHCQFLYPGELFDDLGRIIYYYGLKTIQDFDFTNQSLKTFHKDFIETPTFNSPNSKLIEQLCSCWNSSNRLVRKGERSYLWYSLVENEILALMPGTGQEEIPRHDWILAQRPKEFHFMLISILEEPSGGIINKSAPFPAANLSPLWGYKHLQYELFVDKQKITISPQIRWIFLMQKEQQKLHLLGLNKKLDFVAIEADILDQIKTIVVDHDQKKIVLLPEDLSCQPGNYEQMKQLIASLNTRGLALKPAQPTTKRFLTYKEYPVETTPSMNMQSEEYKQFKETMLTPPLDRDLFTVEELKAMFSLPHDIQQLSPLERARAYDWCGRFSEALSCLEQINTPEGRLELGMFLKAGRPGIPADAARGMAILEKLADEFEAREGSLNGKECLVAGRACMERCPAPGSKHYPHWHELGEDFFERAIELGVKDARYYKCFYSGRGFNETSLWPEWPSDDLEVRAARAALPGYVNRLRKLRRRDEHLEIIRQAIRGRCRVAQYYLGMLYFQYGAYLKDDLGRACFWLQRAADRGVQKAKIQLSASEFKRVKPENIKP